MGWMHPSPISGYHQGMDYTIIDNGKDLLAKLDQWNGLERIAVDFEGEFNLHIYGEHLCLIQVYDGKSYYIIDPRANAMGKEELFPTVIRDGVLPRKTFSMGEAHDKRFYLEARKIRG